MKHPCPRFERCGASLCPLTMEGSHLTGEPICEYLRLAAKGEAIPVTVSHRILRNREAVVSANGDIRRRLKRAALSPKRGANLVRGEQEAPASVEAD